MLPSNLTLVFRATIVGGLVLGAAAAHAQGKVDARYTGSLAGVPLGKGAWVIEIGDDQFTAAASGRAVGLAQVFASGNGAGGSRGIVSGGNPVATSYAVNVVTNKRVDEVRMTLNNGAVKELVVEPPMPPDPEIVPLTDAHRKGILDPMTAALIVVAGTGDLMVQDSCQRTLPVFDGRMRYDMLMTFKRMEKVKADKGYQGPALVCTVLFRPVAGYFREKSAIKYLVDQRDMEMWLVPIAGTRVLVPFRVSVPTPIGSAVLQASQFVTTPLARASSLPETTSSTATTTKAR